MAACLGARIKAIPPFGLGRSRTPVGTTTSTASPLALPIKARAIGEFTDIFPLFALASGSPTIRHTFFSSVSSLTNVTVAPNLIVSPESFDTSITSARASLSSRSTINQLVCLGRVVLRILSQVGIVGNRFLHPLNETWSLDRHSLVQLILKSRVTRGGHGELGHRSLLSAGYSTLSAPVHAKSTARRLRSASEQ